MLALETGWTPDVLAALPLAFKRKCHWALYARAIAGPEGLPSTEIPSGASSEVRLAAFRQNAALLPLRKLLYPEGED